MDRQKSAEHTISQKLSVLDSTLSIVEKSLSIVKNSKGFTEILQI
jgi:hypothetical protein